VMEMQVIPEPPFKKPRLSNTNEENNKGTPTQPDEPNNYSQGGGKISHHKSNYRKSKKSMAKKSLFKKGTRLSKRERKYCSCVAKARAKSFKYGTKANPYAVCTSTLYNKKGKTRKSRIDCAKSYNFKNMTDNQLQSYAKEKGLKMSRKGKSKSRSKLISELKRKLKK
jgi:hypothetical protein